MMLWLQVVQPRTNVHETKWTPHVKWESDVGQSCLTKLTLESMPEAEGKVTTDIIMSKRQEDAS